jgi:hypothetical protein
MSIRIGRAAVLQLFLVASTAGCAHQARVPRSLAAARAECARAENGPARRLQPVAVDEAEAALAAAEAAHKAKDDLAELRAIYAQRKAQLAQSLAATEMARQKEHDAIAQRTVLLEVRAAEARVLAERLGEIPPSAGGEPTRPGVAGAAEMQRPEPPPTTPRAPGSTPQGGPQSGAPPKAR